MAIIAALSPHKLIGGNIASKFSSLQSFVKTFLIFLFAATPPATTNFFSLSPLIFLKSLNAILLFLYNISSIVLWKEAARSYLSFSFFIFFVILRIAV